MNEESDNEKRRDIEKILRLNQQRTKHPFFAGKSIEKDLGHGLPKAKGDPEKTRSKESFSEGLFGSIHASVQKLSDFFKKVEFSERFMHRTVDYSSKFKGFIKSISTWITDSLSVDNKHLDDRNAEKSDKKNKKY